VALGELRQRRGRGLRGRYRERGGCGRGADRGHSYGGTHARADPRNDASRSNVADTIACSVVADACSCTFFVAIAIAIAIA